MAVDQVLQVLASDAAKTVVAAAATDAWSWSKKAFVRLMGRGEAGRAELYEGRLEATSQELASASAGELEQVQQQLEAAWQTRVLDVLEEEPDLAPELRGILEQVQREVPGGSVAASGRGVAIGHDAIIRASENAVAAVSIKGNVSTANPTEPGSASI